MVTHRLHMAGTGFGVAGLWEDCEGFGPCNTLLITVPKREVGAAGQPQHDRPDDPTIQGELFQVPSITNSSAAASPLCSGSACADLTLTALLVSLSP